MREDWVEVELGEVLIQSKDKHKPEKVESLFYIGLEHIEKSTGCLTNSASLAEIKTVKNKFSKGQLLYGKLRPYLNKVYLSHESGVCSTDILVFEVSQILLGKFALLLMLSRKFVNDMSANTNGVNLPRVSTKYVNAYPFPLPPLPEQHAIVAKIEALFSDLDKGIADLKKAQDQLKIYRQAVLKKAFEGELTKEWRAQQTNLPTAEELLEQIKEERQKHYEQQFENWKQAVKTWEENGKEGKKPRKLKAYKDLLALEKKELDYLGLIPSQWKWEKSSNVMKLITNGTTPKGGKVSTIKNEVPYLKIHNLSLRGEFLLDYKLHYISLGTSTNNLYRSRIFPNDVLINTVGPPLGKSCLVSDSYPEYNTNQNVTVYRTFDSYSPKLLNYFMVSSGTITWIKEVATATSGQSYMNLGHCRNIPIPILSIEEQHQIVQEIESRLSVCDKVEQSITESLEKAKALRQSILKKAFEGKLLSKEEIAACKAAADYEPASVLLEKIKAEKAVQTATKKAKRKKK